MNEIFEIFPIPMAVCDTNGDVLFVNLACRELLNSIHIPESDFARVLPKSYRTSIKSVIADHRGHEMDYVFEERFLHLTFKASEEGSHAYIFIRDITVQEEAKAQLIQSEKMASLGLLSAGLAHEINTPLGAIHSNTDILSRSIGKVRELLSGVFSENTEAERIMAIAEEVCVNNVAATERLMSIVGSLKNFARLDEAECKEADIHEGLNSTLTLVQHLMKNRIEVVKQYGELPNVECFPNQLNQVFMNLLVNAAQAIPEKGTITIKTWADDGAIHMAISDTGSGIAAENLSRVFDPGFTTKGVGVGTGLGLAISYKIIKEHDGTIDVESSPLGSTFTVTLPTTRSNEVSHA